MGMRRLHWLTVALIALAVFLPLSNAGAAPPEGEKIAYYSGTGIYFMNPDGSGKMRVATGNYDLPVISPDGSKIAYQKTRNGNVDVYVSNADGSEERRLTDNSASDGAPSWSPDGKRVAFQSNRGGDYNIYIMSVDGNGVRRVTGGGYDFSPDWSPRGDEIAFERKGIIYTVSISSGNTSRLTEGGSPDWSPDGSRIAFDDGFTGNVFVINADGSGRRQLTSGRLSSTSPAWSPDGGKIAYSQGLRGERLSEIYTINADGSGKEKVASDDRLSLFTSDWGKVSGDPEPVAPPPQTSITRGPSGAVSSGSARFSFSSNLDGASFRCSLDGRTFRPCSSPQSYDDLKDGVHRFQVRAVRSDGTTDSSPATRRWRVDTRQPTIRNLNPSPGAKLRNRTPTVRAFVRDRGPRLQRSDIRLIVDGEREDFAYNRWNGRLSDHQRLSPGWHRVRIVATDRAGNTAVRQWGFKVLKPRSTYAPSPLPNFPQIHLPFR